MTQYLILIVGWILGQAFYATIKAWMEQKKHASLSFTEALKIVYSQTASFIICWVMLALALFFLPEITVRVINADPEATNHAPGWMRGLIAWFRVTSVVFGAFSQWLALLLFGRVQTAITNFIGSKFPDQKTDS